jgi:hypothetical protein
MLEFGYCIIPFIVGSLNIPFIDNGFNCFAMGFCFGIGFSLVTKYFRGV